MSTEVLSSCWSPGELREMHLSWVGLEEEFQVGLGPQHGQALGGPCLRRVQSFLEAEEQIEIATGGASAIQTLC